MYRAILIILKNIPISQMQTVNNRPLIGTLMHISHHAKEAFSACNCSTKILLTQANSLWCKYGICEEDECLK